MEIMGGSENHKGRENVNFLEEQIKKVCQNLLCASYSFSALLQCQVSK